MDWTLAIERNTEALKRIVAMLVAMAGLGAPFTSPSRGEVAPRSGAGGGDTASPQTGGEPGFRPTLPRRLHRAVLRLLRPAESAVRRLIIIAARGLVVAPSAPPRVRKPKPPSIFLRNGVGTGIIMPRGTLLKPPRPAPLSIALPLFDPLQRPFRRRSRPAATLSVPRISFPGYGATLSPVKLRRLPTPDDLLDATRLKLRLQALAAALDDLPKQAQRLARWRANHDAALRKSRDAAGTQDKTAVRRFSPLRPGRPPGFSRRLDHDMREMLTDLHGLAYDVLEYPDTS